MLPPYGRQLYDFGCGEAILQCEGDYSKLIRGAIALGGDSDTIASMAGGIAAATFGIPRSMRKQALAYFFDDELSVLQTFEAKFGAAKETTDA